MTKAYDKTLSRVEDRIQSKIVQYLGSPRFEEDVDSFIKFKVQREVKKRIEWLIDRDVSMKDTIQSTAEKLLEKIRKTRLKKNEIDALLESVSADYKSTIEQALDDLAADRAGLDAAEIFRKAIQKLKLPEHKEEEEG